MKFRILSLAALMLFASFSTVSALRIQSQPITQLKVSQTSYSKIFPFDIRGKIWGTAPKGEVTRILYSIEDASETKTWEFSEPFKKTFEGTEELDLDFKFDFKDVLVDGNCTLLIELQKSTMNGAFAQTVANGSMSLKFPPRAVEKKALSKIEMFNAFFDKTSAVTQIRFKNMQKEGKFTVKAQLLGATGEVIQKKTSAVLPLARGEEKEISVLLDAPAEPGRYTVEVQVFKGKVPVTGIKEMVLIKKGDFAIISELEITPNQYFYVDDVATIRFAGRNSSWGEPLIVKLVVKNSDKKEVFTKAFPVQTDEIGRFSGETKFTIASETAQLHVVTKLRKGVKTLGVYEYSTRPLKKLHATEGQSELSFAMEKASQEFEFSGLRVKMGVIIGIGILILLIVGFIFFIRHMRHLKLFILLLAFFVAGVDAATNSEYPSSPGFVINPSATDNFKTLKFKGNIDLFTSNAFVLDTDITVVVHFKDIASSGDTLYQTDSIIFKTLVEPNEYEFFADAPAAMLDGEYPLELVFTGDGVVEGVAPLEVDLQLTIFADSTSPVSVPSGMFQYFDSGSAVLESGDFTNQPVQLGVVCDDETGCRPEGAEIFKVQGNFCPIADPVDAFCETGKTDDFILCDKVGNCTVPAQVDIHHYDPVAPEITSLDLKDTAGSVSATTLLKALDSYVFSLFGLADPDTTTDAVTIDNSACGDPLTSPFVDDGTNCVEKEVSCTIIDIVTGEYLRGSRAHDEDNAACDSCPFGTIPTPEGICVIVPLSVCPLGYYDKFPFCFTWTLKPCSQTQLPLCFDIIAQ